MTQTCRECRFRFERFCNWFNEFISAPDGRACDAFEPRHGLKSQTARWCGAQLGWCEDDALAEALAQKPLAKRKTMPRHARNYCRNWRG